MNSNQNIFIPKSTDGKFIDDEETSNYGTLLPFNNLLDLPLTVVLDSLAQFLSFRDLMLINKVSLYHGVLFKKPFLCKKAKAFFEYVMATDYDAVEHIVSVTPELMFETVQLLEDGQIEKTTALEYAFKNYDTHMYQIFLKAVENKPDLYDLFLKQLAEPMNHLNLDTLFKAYKTFIKESNIYAENGYVGNGTLDQPIFKALCDLAYKQRILPLSMWKIFCGSIDWNPKFSFSVDDNPRPKGACQVHLLPQEGVTREYDEQGGFTDKCMGMEYKGNLEDEEEFGVGQEFRTMIESHLVLVTLDLEELGEKFAIIRGSSVAVTFPIEAANYLDSELLKHDLSTLRCLLKQKVREFEDFKLHLNSYNSRPRNHSISNN